MCKDGKELYKKAFLLPMPLYISFKLRNKVSTDKRNGEITSNTLTSKGDVTRDDSQRRFLAQHSVATLLVMLHGTICKKDF